MAAATVFCLVLLLAPNFAQAQEGDPADSVCQRFATGSVAAPPPELQSVNGVLEVTFQFRTAVDLAGNTRYCYVTPGGLESPTLRVNPGDRLIVHLQNTLPAGNASMASVQMQMRHDASPTDDTDCTGIAMAADNTNMHFHGMNVPPLCHQDEVINTLVPAGQSFDYNLQIPANEPPGLYWYHPHPHGFSEGQVQGGATGALIVNGIENIVTSLAGLPERTFVLRDQAVTNTNPTDPAQPAWDISLDYVPILYPGYNPAVVQVPAGEKEFWRVANTSADTIYNLQVLVNGVAQTLQVVAVDGYPVGGDSTPVTVSYTTLPMGPGARAEFIITTPNAGDTAQIVTLNENTGPYGDNDPDRPIANLVATDSPSAVAAARKVPPVAHPMKVARFKDLSSTPPTALRHLYFDEFAPDPVEHEPSGVFITVEGQPDTEFSMGQPPNLVVHQGTVEDWIVQNRSLEEHVFHIHQLHFQVMEVNGAAVTDPALRDTVDIPYYAGTGPYPSVKLRMDFRDPEIVGTFVYHCHILSHEDQGMMASIQVIPAGMPATATVASATSTPGLLANTTLTATVAPAATGGPPLGGSVQFFIDNNLYGNSVPLSGGTASLVVLFQTLGRHTINATYSGDTNYNAAQAADIPVTVSNPGFSLSAGGAITANAGQTGTATIALAPVGGFNSAVGLTCSLPSGLNEASCSISPSSLTGSGTATLSVSTTAAHTVGQLVKPPRPRGHGWFVVSGAASLACVFLMGFPLRKRRWYWPTFFVLLAIACVSGTVGCGGGSSSTGGTQPQTDPGTNPGSYTVVVTGTSGSGSSQIQSTVNVSMTVN